MEDLSNEFFIENSSINMEILNNITRKITAGAYPVCITEIEWSSTNTHESTVSY